MTRTGYLTTTLLLSTVLVTIPALAQQDYQIKPVPFTSVTLTDNFWLPRLKTNKQVTIPVAFEKATETGRIDNFKVAGGMKQGGFCSLYGFDDSDVYKNIEGASYSLQTFPDPQLEAYLDTLISYITAAQEKDGYLYTARTTNPEHPIEMAGNTRWEKEEEGSHELYNAGHLYEAAVAHYQATGKRTLLDVAIRNANLVDSVFGWGKLEKVPGHQEIEIGLVKLYRVTGDRKYLDLAKFFLDRRGPGGDEYAQMHKRVVDQDEAVGHAVRAQYMYAAMADVAALTGDQAYVNALDKIWHDVVYTKTYLTGGIGAAGGYEGFGPSYDLPNLTSYCETCAAIANVLWNQRMFLLKGDSQYYDVLERVLYNGLISGVSLSGDRFFYPNPLASMGQHERAAWFGCACCPVNISRFVPSVPGYIYATSGNRIYVNLFIQNTAGFIVGDNKVTISQMTDYPWNGNVTINIEPARTGRFQVYIRIPGWAREMPIPGDLYKFEEPFRGMVVLKVNGKEEKMTMDKGYAVLEQDWKKGDRIDLEFPMPVRRIIANEKVIDDHGRVALQRGPLVYCAEGIDQPGNRVMDISLEKNATYAVVSKPDLLGGMNVIEGKAVSTKVRKDGNMEELSCEFKAVPYYSWENRGPGEMEVWFAKGPDLTIPAPQPSIASKSKTEAMTGTRNLKAVNDQYSPAGSDDHSIIYSHWWPIKDTIVWIQYQFNKEEEISSSKIYWFDDGPDGGCRVPTSWKLLYKHGDQWQPVKNPSLYGIDKDRFNEVRFDKVKTCALRLEVLLQNDYSGGVYEWEVK
jgi:DUF1680 family protein